MAMASYAPFVSSQKLFIQFPCNLQITPNLLSFSDSKAPIFSSPPTNAKLLQHNLKQITRAQSKSKEDMLMKKIEDAIYRKIVKNCVPDWLVFIPGASYWVPPRRSYAGVDKMAMALMSPLNKEQHLAAITLQGYPSSDFFFNNDLPTELVEDSKTTPLNSEDPNDHPTELVEESKFVPLNAEDPEDLPTELVEDSKFVPLNAEDPRYGPPVLLLMGFSVEEAEKIQQLLKELEGEFLKIVFCTENMIDQSLWEAVNTEQSNLDVSKIAKSLPRICVLSGLTGEEMMMFIDAFPETGLESPAFAALVPNSADKPLSELIEEIMGDHEMLSARE